MRKNKTVKLIVIFVLSALGLNLSKEFHIPLLDGLCGSILVITGFLYFVLGFKKN